MSYMCGFCNSEPCECKAEYPTFEEVTAVVKEAVANEEAVEQIAYEAANEAKAAVRMWPPMNSAHEGFAILHEEFDELKEHVWTNQKKRDLAAMRKEAIQVAAMAIRFVNDVIDSGRGRV